MAKRGFMDPNAGAPPLPGVPHIGNKLQAAPKQRNNLLNTRLAPPRRTEVQVKPMKMATTDDSKF